MIAHIRRDSFNVATFRLVRSAAASKVNFIVLRPPGKSIGTTTIVVILVLVADPHSVIQL